MRKKWIIAAGLCVFITTAGIGCGAKGEEPQTVTVEEISLPGAGQVQEDGDLTDSLEGEKNIEKLEGNVKSIGDGSAVIIRAITEERDDGSFIMVGSAAGYEAEEDLVNVSFEDTAEYELRIVKNGGVNPDEDVSIKKAAFSDIKEHALISLEGYYEGDTFIAEKVILYEFV